jgi:hypothetical protein
MRFEKGKEPWSTPNSSKHINDPLMIDHIISFLLIKREQYSFFLRMSAVMVDEEVEFERKFIGGSGGYKTKLVSRKDLPESVYPDGSANLAERFFERNVDSPRFW